MLPGMALRIGIIGCGSTGLAAAAFLTRDGHAVSLFEQVPAPRPVGAGLLLQPIGLACLARLGLDQEAISYGMKVQQLHGLTHTGREIFDLDYRNLAPHYFGLGIHRGSLFHLLYEEAKRLGFPVTTACRVEDSRITGRERVLIDADGREYGPFDLVIDASGVKSPLRAAYGAVKVNEPYPYGAAWGVCDDPGQQFALGKLQQRYDTARVMIGVLGIGTLPERPDKHHVAFFWSLPVSTYQKWRETPLETWQARVIDYWPETARFVEQFNTHDDLTFASYGDIIMRRWHSERLVFIGDAAHTTSPQLGQGANLGLVDAMILAECLDKHRDIQDALSAYSKQRKAHLRFYQTASRWLTPFFQSDSRLAAWVRDTSFGLMSKLPYIKTEMMHTLAGTKTGIFTHCNPGAWHPAYDLRSSASKAAID